MNFTPFGATFAAGSLPAGHQFTTAKFTQQVGTTAGGQVVGLLSSDDQGVTYLRPVDTNGATFALSLPQATGNNQHNQIIALPITMPGKPGEMGQQQTVQIQVVNPANTSGGEKYTLPIALPQLQQGQGCENIVVGVIDPSTLSAAGGLKMITLAYNPQGGVEGQGIHLQLQHTDENGEVHQHEQDHMQQHNNNNNNTSTSSSQTMHCEEMVLPDVKPMLSEGDGGQAYPVAVVAQITPEMLSVRQEDMEVDKDGNPKEKEKQDNEDVGKVITVDCTGESYTTLAWQSNSAVADYFNRAGLSIRHFLKFPEETIKREQAIESSPLSNTGPDAEESTVDMNQTVVEEQIDDPNNPEALPRKKKKYKKKAPKPRRPRPGQVHIATALDGTTLFCCPECNMAYPDKELLEQHLVAHKIERRFICDICGAGLKRKEHLERHKLGHNPERPYICSVCCKGFKRKEHLNLHFVIHSGEKTEVCTECGKGFYRKDHLRKHARSHMAKRVKEELQHVQASAAIQASEASTNTVVLPSSDNHGPTPVALVTQQ